MLSHASTPDDIRLLACLMNSTVHFWVYFGTSMRKQPQIVASSSVLHVDLVALPDQLFFMFVYSVYALYMFGFNLVHLTCLLYST